jgi:hypothetical protein
MALTVGDRADREILYRMLGTNLGGTAIGVPGDTLTLRLFKNGRVLSKSDSRGWGANPYFIEATGAGYGKIYLQPTGWTIYTNNPGTGDSSIAQFAQQTFTFTGADSIAGYMLQTVKCRTIAVPTPAGVADSILMWAEKFADGPYIIPAGGGTIKITPRIIMS